MPRPNTMHEIEAKEGRPIHLILSELYEQHGSQKEVANALGIHPSTLHVWLLKLGLEQRTVLVQKDAAS